MYIEIVSWLLLLLVSSSNGEKEIDWWDVLSTELSCCSTHSNSYDCSNEGANDCSFVDVTETCATGPAGKECRFKQRLANEFGACLQESFVACKVAAGKINACCAPGCNGITPPAGPPPAGGPPASGVAPVCFPKVTPAPVTPSPVTPSPVTPSPVTPSPVTPSPVTPSPVTPSPTTPSPTTPSPTTPAPTTPEPTTKEPTPRPTAKPTTEEGGCVMGENYAFSGVACQISGDPHVKKVQGGKHDFQGQPLVELNGNMLDQYYYVARCVSYGIEDMPYQIIGRHQPWGTRVVNGIDYLTIELSTNGGTIYLYASSDQNGIPASYGTSSNGATQNYDDTVANGVALTPLTSNVATTVGIRYEVTFVNLNNYNKASFKIKIDHDDNGVFNDEDDAEIYIYMQGQMGRVYDDAYGATRFRMHYVYLKQDDKYKCAACGLCGSYNGKASTSELELCDGSIETVRAGWNGVHQPEAYDLFGLTYEYNYFNDNCVYDYDITDNTDALVYVDPCDTNIAQDVIDECARVAQEECCPDTAGEAACAELQEDCEFDACVVATDAGGSESDIADAVEETLGNAIDLMCGIPDVGDDLDTGNLLQADYIGCYNDDSTRTFTYGTRCHSDDNLEAGECPGRVINVANQQINECVDICTEYEYQYMGLQYGKECFCSNDLSTNGITRLGEQTDKSKCGQYDNYQDEYGCWGGDWTSCVYDLSANYEDRSLMKILQNKQRKARNDNNNIFGVESMFNINNMGKSLENGYIQIGVIGFSVILIGGVLYYKKLNDKDSKYIPIDDPKV